MPGSDKCPATGSGRKVNAKRESMRLFAAITVPTFFLFCFSVLKSKKNSMGIVRVDGIEMSEKRIETNQKGISTQIKKIR